MKSAERKIEDMINLVYDEQKETCVTEVYESGYIMNMADNMDREEVYKCFKKVIENEIKKRRIKNVRKWVIRFIDNGNYEWNKLVWRFLKEHLEKDKGRIIL